ncbi:FtsX-like permease family protein [Bacillus aquiflavi]|uniref:FtsX-like permease family protein n=1 Tax=Bacillus aquiflavi TaxID=2672567 RepID=A0A6B3VNX1_9BACI|nr:ABC transporter permease [Bacillus aquiflavi]MBA4535614.1 FtsX-like permease family protein [Bacillus aquiflavi]NEY79990.1 FtsX-like permease family protein [Bacillus aquiflavi]
MKNYYQIIWKYFKVNSKRTILTIIGIILSVALMTTIGLFLLSLQANMVETEKQINGGYHIMFKRGDEQLLKKLKGHPQVDKVEMVENAERVVIENRYLQVQKMTNLEKELLPYHLEKGRLPKNKDEIAIETWVLPQLADNPKLNEKITLTFEDEGKREYILTGLLRNQGKDEAIAVTETKEVNVNNASILVEINKKADLAKIVKELAKLTDEDNYTINERLLKLLGGSTSDRFNQTVYRLVAFVIAMIVIATIAVIYNAFHISVVQRIQHFGLLQAIGMTKKQLRGIVLREATYLSIISIPLGLCFGTIAYTTIIYLFNSMNETVFTNLEIIYSPNVFMISALISMCSIYLSALLPAWTAMKISPLTAISQRQSFTKERIKRKSSPWFKKLFGMNSLLALKNMKRNRKRFYITVSSMIISVSLFITFTSLLKMSGMFIEDLGEAEKVDFVIVNDSVNHLLTDDLKERLASIKGVETIYTEYPIVQSNAMFEEKLVNQAANDFEITQFKMDGLNLKMLHSNIYVVNDEELETLLQSAKMKGSNDIQKMHEENGIILIKNNYLFDYDQNKMMIIAMINGKVGTEFFTDPTFLYEEDYKPIKENFIKMKISAIAEDHPYSSNGNGISYIMLRSTAEKLLDNGEELIAYSFRIKLQDKKYEKEVMAKIEEIIGNNAILNIINQIDEVRERRAMFVKVNTLVYGFISVITLIGIINIANTVTTNLLLRKKEFAMLQAVGMTGKDIRKMIATEGILYGIFGAFFGSITGVGCSIILFTILSGIRGFELTIYYDVIAIATIMSILIGLVSALIPLRKMKNQNIIENIREID